ncbi:MAG: hypothetical protein ACLPN5_19065, partial [Roseiarcus sp.]
LLSSGFACVLIGAVGDKSAPQSSPRYPREKTGKPTGFAIRAFSFETKQSHEHLAPEPVRKP